MMMKKMIKSSIKLERFNERQVNQNLQHLNIQSIKNLDIYLMPMIHGIVFIK